MAILCTELLYRYHWCSRESSGGATSWGSWCSVVCHLSCFAPGWFQDYSVGRKLCLALWFQCALTCTFLLISDSLNHPTGILLGKSMVLASVQFSTNLTMLQSLKLQSGIRYFLTICSKYLVCSDIMSDHSKLHWYTVCDHIEYTLAQVMNINGSQNRELAGFRFLTILSFIKKK